MRGPEKGGGAFIPPRLLEGLTFHEGPVKFTGPVSELDTRTGREGPLDGEGGERGWTLT